MENNWQSKIKPTVAMLLRQCQQISIQILLEPFHDGQELLTTRIRLDGINIPSVYLKDLVGNSYKFPRNPVDGYIDGSIYVAGTHCPIDVFELSFYAARDGTATVVVKGYYCCEPPELTERRFVINAQAGSFTV